ncbi:MAG TPA: hypothetical protein VM509_14950 [Planctomycetota bacterium]|nr:hypothetical protein [Planctomycetota bacterium]
MDSQSAKTDGEGRFVFEHVPAGEFMVVLPPADDGSERQTETAEQESRGRSKRLLVEEGRDTNVIFGEPGSIHVRGRVQRGNVPAAAVKVRILDVGASGFFEVVNSFPVTQGKTDASGRFDLALESAGKYRVQAIAKDSGMPTGPELDIAADGIDSIEIALGSGRIAGVAHHSRRRATGFIRVSLQRAPQEDAWETVMGHESSFDFSDLSPGTYTLEASAWLTDKLGRPNTMLGPVTRTIVLADGQQVMDLKIEVNRN